MLKVRKKVETAYRFVILHWKGCSIRGSLDVAQNVIACCALSSPVAVEVRENSVSIWSNWYEQL